MQRADGVKDVGVFRKKECSKFQVLGWKVINQNLAVKARLHNSGLTDEFCVTCNKEETIKHVFWCCRADWALWV